MSTLTDTREEAKRLRAAWSMPPEETLCRTLRASASEFLIATGKPASAESAGQWVREQVDEYLAARGMIAVPVALARRCATMLTEFMGDDPPPDERELHAELLAALPGAVSAAGEDAGGAKAEVKDGD